MGSDGAECTMTITNTPDIRENGKSSLPGNMNLVTYTVYHGDASSVEIKPIVMFQGDNKDIETIDLLRIRDCFFPKLNEYIDSTAIYTSNDPSSKAIDWLMKVSGEHSNCESKDFLDRYKLGIIHFGGGCDVDSSSGDNPSECEVCPLGFKEPEKVVELGPGFAATCEQGVKNYITPLLASESIDCDQAVTRAATAGCLCSTSEPQQDKMCVEGFLLPLTEDACATAATANGLSLGGPYPFAGDYPTKGCFWYRYRFGPDYVGQAYFGTGGSDAEMQMLEITDPDVARLSCRECV